MKKIIFLLILIVNFNLFSQESEKMKSKDSLINIEPEYIETVKQESPLLKKMLNEPVLFVCFEGNNNLEQKIHLGNNQNKKSIFYNSYNYQFHFKNSSYDRLENPVTLVYQKYIDFNAKLRDDKSIVVKLHKSFLRKNKDVIITRKTIDKLGKQEFLNLLSSAYNKTMFLIDKTETTNNKITIKEVKLSYIFDE